MTELSKRLHFLKNGVEQTAKAYSTIDEVGNNYINVKIDGKPCYVAIGDIDDSLATKGRVLKNGVVYAIKSEAVPPITFTLVCKNVADDSVITSVKYKVPSDGILYFNNDNAPVIPNYDFVSIDGIKKTDVGKDEVVNVYYVGQSVYDRNKMSWRRYFENNTYMSVGDVVNTYSATTIYGMYYKCTSLVTVSRMNTSNVTDMGSLFDACGELTTIPEMDTSNVTNMNSLYASCAKLTSVPKLNTSKVTNMNRMYYGCDALTTVPEMDTSKVTSMRYMFAFCDSLKSIPEMNTSNVTDMNYMFGGCKLETIGWDIDMRSCTDCDYMFFLAETKNIRLKNVPRSLDLSKIGTTSYTVVNYID